MFTEKRVIFANKKGFSIAEWLTGPSAKTRVDGSNLRVNVTRCMSASDKYVGKVYDDELSTTKVRNMRVRKPVRMPSPLP